MTRVWLLALVLAVALRQVASTPSTCLSTAIESGRRLFEVQEKFYKCYKDCIREILGGSTSGTAPDFTLNLLSMAKSAGISLCSRLCYDKIVDVLPAGSAAQPFLVYNQIAQNLVQCIGNDKSNLFISELAKFNLDNLNHSPTFTDPRTFNLFSIFYPDVLQLFWAGVGAYDESENCKEGIAIMKSAMAAYTNNLNLCQHFCLISFAGPNSDPFTMLNSVAKCQHSCFYVFRADPTPDKSLLHPASEIHHFLQYCLWHTGAKSYALAHAASFSLLEPSDTSLVEYYVGGGIGSKDDFKPKPDAVYLKEQLDTLNAVIKINAAVSDVSPSKLASIINSMTMYGVSNASKTQTKPISTVFTGTCNAGSPSTCASNVNAFKVVANLTGIENYRRYIVDDVLGSSQCEKLISINKKAGKMGDGFQITKQHGSPYTDHESFFGLNTLPLADLLTEGTLAPEDVQLYLGVVDSVLEKTKQLHGLKELYPHYVHLVCRNVINGEDNKGNREPSADPSHPVHSDNCNIQESGDCLDNNPTISPRNYTAVLYLNNEFEGGEIFFTRRPSKIEEGRIYPECGRVVSFQSGEFHGVRAVTKGTRCAFAMWFTLDKASEDRSIAKAREVVSKILNMTTDDAPPAPTGPETS